MPTTTKAGTANQPPVSSSDVEEFVDLNDQQKLFCRCYLNGFTVIRKDEKGGERTERVRMGNGVKSYAFAYEHDDIDYNPSAYNVCMAAASRLLRDVKILSYLDDLKVVNGWTTQAMDNRLNEIAFTGKHENSIKAIQEMSKIEGRITEKIQQNGSVTVVSAIPRPTRSESNQPDGD